MEKKKRKEWIRSYAWSAPSLLLIGLMGFLLYNYNPAKVFMGDTGSLFLGGMVVALAALKKRSPVRFSLRACLIDQSNGAMEPELLAEYLETLDIPLTIIKHPTYQIMKERDERSPCSLWANIRRGILANSGVNDEQIAAFQRECDEQYGENAALNPNNIIESKKFEITTPEVKISIAPENSYMIEARVINGRKYLLIPADDGVEVNGIGVNIPGLAKEE